MLNWNLKKQKSYETDKSNLIIRSIDTDNETLEGALGLTPERLKVIASVLESTITGKDKTSACLEEVSKQLLHANEIFYLGMLVQRLHTENEKNESFMKLLKQLKRRNSESED